MFIVVYFVDMIEQKNDELIESITYYQSLFDQIKRKYEEARHFTVWMSGLQGSDEDLFFKALEIGKGESRWEVIQDNNAQLTFIVSRDDSLGIGTFLCDFQKGRLQVNALAELLSSDTCQLDYKSLYRSSSIPSGWDEETWGKSKEIIGEIKNTLESVEHKQFNNENTLRKLKDMSNFRQLQEFIDQEGIKVKRSLTLQELEELKTLVANRISHLLDRSCFLKKSIGTDSAEELRIVEEERRRIDEQRRIIEKKAEWTDKFLSRQNLKDLLSDAGIDENSFCNSKNLHIVSASKISEVVNAYMIKFASFEQKLQEKLENELHGIIDLSSVGFDLSIETINIEEIRVKARKESSFIGDDGILDINLERERDRISYLLEKEFQERSIIYSDSLYNRADVFGKYIYFELSRQLQRLKKNSVELDERQETLNEIVKIGSMVEAFRSLQDGIEMFIKKI